MFCDATAKVSDNVARGLDGWGPAEFKALGRNSIHFFTTLYTLIEDGLPWPVATRRGRVALIPKPGSAWYTATSLRPLSILSYTYRVWSGTRGRQLAFCLSEHAPAVLRGCLAGTDTSQSFYEVALRCE